ncbi:MAG: YggS family pyridoxal phosphate-dependent enzyme [Nitrospirota bacterium]
MLISDNLQKIKERIKEAAYRVGRNPAEIKLVAVTKGVEPDRILEAIQARVEIIGENRVQEVKAKYEVIKTQVEWHLVGHLQKNKVKDAVKLFSLIHSVDSFELAKEIDKRAAQIGKVQDILIEVNTSGESTKFGVVPSAVEKLLIEIKYLPNIRIQGLMTIAPDNPESARPYFRILKELNDKFRLKYLSMGMSNDFELAIEEGANIVRIGRAIFKIN